LYLYAFTQSLARFQHRPTGPADLTFYKVMLLIN
jgi:hypothetical protein